MSPEVLITSGHGGTRHSFTLPRKLHVDLSILCVFMSALFSQEPGRRNIAVLPFDARGVSSVEAEAVADRIRNELTMAGVYQVVERGLMEEIMQEQAFQLTGACTESSCLVEVGRILAVHLMAGGSVTRVGNLFTIEARIVDVESGEIVKNVIEDYMGPIENLLVYTSRKVARHLMGLEKQVEALTLGGTSDLSVQSNPSGATIYVNDGPLGDITPYTIQGLLEGEYSVKVKKGNLVAEKIIVLRKHEIKEISLDLEPEKFLIRVSSQPSGSDVYVNGDIIGQSPLDHIVTDTTISYNIILQKELHKTTVDTVRFAKEAILRLHYDMDASGKIIIPYLTDVTTYINEQTVDHLPSVTVRKKSLTGSKQLVIDQLDLGNYSVRMVKPDHHPLESTLSLTAAQPIQTIYPDFEMLEHVIVDRLTDAKRRRNSNLGATAFFSGIGTVFYLAAMDQKGELTKREALSFYGISAAAYFVGAVSLGRTVYYQYLISSYD